MPFSIHEPRDRAQLEVRAKPYFVRITEQMYLGYRKGKSLSRWVVRERVQGRYRTLSLPGVEPDDHYPADGQRILSFQQAVGEIMSNVIKKANCSFCGKGQTEVKKLVAGPGVFICDGCVRMCQLYIEHNREDQKLLIENGEPVFEQGKPVFVPLTAEELARQAQLRETPA